MTDIFYCCSNRLSHFIRAFDIPYIDIGINKKSNTKYYVFQKSDRLDKVIELYNQVKHSI